MKSTPNVGTQKKAPRARSIPKICGKVESIFPNTKLELMRSQEGPARMCRDGTTIIYQRFVVPRISMLLAEAIHVCRGQRKRKVTREHLRVAIMKMSSHKMPTFV